MSSSQIITIDPSEDRRVPSLREKLGQASDDEIESVLATRELVEPEPELSSDMVARLQERIRKRA
jgi:hypothetical protein